MREKVVLCLHEKDALLIVTFMQDGATSYTANLVKEFLIQIFGEERTTSKLCKFSWFPLFPDLTPADFWL